MVLDRVSLPAVFALVLAAAGASAVLSSACTNPTSKPPPSADLSSPKPIGAGGGGGTADGGLVDGGADAGALDGGACNDLTLGGPTVDVTAVSQDAPQADAGTILDGTYTLTQVLIYVGVSGTPGPTGTSLQGALSIQGATMQRVLRQVAVDAGTAELRTTATVTTSDTTLTSTQTCPTGAGVERDVYTATATSLVVTNPTTHEEYTFTKN